MSRRILYVGGDAQRRELVRRLLEGSGFAMEGVLANEGGMPAALPDLVVVDGQAPGGPDAEQFARLRRNGWLAGVPLVALGSSEGDVGDALLAGCEGFIALPIDEKRFVEEVKAHLRGEPEWRSAEWLARKRLAERDRKGSAFIHDLAHQLSTPLTPLAGYVKILQSERLGPLLPQQRKVVEAMAGSISRLTRVLDNLSDFASLQAGPGAISPVLVDPDALAEEVVSELRGAVRDARLHLVVRPSSGGPVMADRKKLRQALANLIQNAVKFSPHGGEVLVEVTRDGATLRFAVLDQGPGVAAADLDRIFEPFGRPDRPGEARVPGSGLGLPVARRIAEAHGGRVLVESPPLRQPSIGGHQYTGAKFVLEIPAKAEVVGSAVAPG
jgi:signal transduction histidine kinase